MKNADAINATLQILDLSRMNATLDRLFEGYTGSPMAENDEQNQRMALTEDFFNFKRLLKSLENDQD